MKTRLKLAFTTLAAFVSTVFGLAAIDAGAYRAAAGWLFAAVIWMIPIKWHLEDIHQENRGQQ